MAEPLATVADLIDRLGRDLTPAEAARADALLADASAAVRAYTGQTITAVVGDVVTMAPYGCWLTLPQRPVTAVTLVEASSNGLDFVEVTDYTRRLDQLYHGYDWRWEVRITYSHGYAVPPDAIVSVVCAMVIRGLAGGSNAAGYQSEQIGEYSYRLADGAQSGALGLLLPERRILDRFRRSARSVPLR